MAEHLKRKTYKSWLTEGVILAGAPVFGYLLVFAYEAGFCSIFGIPPEFISLKGTSNNLNFDAQDFVNL
jgi:hypothetical protein